MIKNSKLLQIIKDFEDKNCYGKVSINFIKGKEKSHAVGVKVEEDIRIENTKEYGD